MKTRFFEEFWRADNGFWIMNQTQTYLAIAMIGLLILLFSLIGVGLILKTILSVVLGGLIGFGLGMKIKDVESWRYIYARLLFQIQKMVINHGETVLLASSYQTQSSSAGDEDAYSVVSVQSSLPKDL